MATDKRFPLRAAGFAALLAAALLRAKPGAVRSSPRHAARGPWHIRADAPERNAPDLGRADVRRAALARFAGVLFRIAHALAGAAGKARLPGVAA